MPFLLNEDKALKSKLQGLMVHDATSGAGRRVTVRYKNPEYEMADATYPLALITHSRISRDEEREHRGVVNLHYAPEGYAPWADMADPTLSPYTAEMPIPLNIDYQIDAYARKETHLIEITGALMGFDYFPHRFGYLSVPEDGTVRRLDLMGGPEYSETKDDKGKRLFIASWAIRVSSEIFLSEIRTLTPAQRVLIGWLDKAAWDEGHSVPISTPQVVTKDPLTVVSAPLASALVGHPYRQHLEALGGSGQVTWTLSEGSRLPQGLHLTATGVLHGMPVAATTSPAQFQVSARDSDATPQVAQAVFSLTVLPSPPGG
ncbi:putative Ig domain-containing protein [Streptomyces sp. MMBL 11-1]|uniref:putative Ig domain-containing protein n=1 Tax=Streptomyces sp. MMBL 11-1 TaxID=3026420 RepID=UPI00235DD86D|nr:putative Ig domain-containing protein [Streptomyces sp. MMBL 11-1]